MTKKELLIKDYEMTQAFIDKMDKYLFWIRNWTIVMCSGVIVYSVTEQEPIVLFSNIVICLGFLFLELIQKSFHEDAIAHGSELENIIQNKILKKEPIPKDYKFGIGRSIKTIELKRLKNILLHKGRWHNVAFYLLIFLLTLISVLFTGI